jgi:hypothetical protein
MQVCNVNGKLIGTTEGPCLLSFFFYFLCISFIILRVDGYSYNVSRRGFNRKRVDAGLFTCDHWTIDLYVKQTLVTFDLFNSVFQ